MPYRFNLPPDAPCAERARRPRPSLASMFRRRLIGVGMATGALVGIVQYVGVHQDRHRNNVARLTVGVQLTAELISQYVATHQAAVSLMSWHRPQDPRWAQHLTKLQQDFPAFDALAVLDAQGRMVSHVPEGPESRAPSFAVPPVGERLGHVSDVQPGFSPGDAPVVIFSAPLLDAANQPQGTVQASVKVTSIARAYTDALKRRDVLMLVLDRRNRVIHASEGMKIRPMDRLQDGLRTALPGQDLPVLTGVLENGGDAYYATTKTRFGWTIAILKPTAALAAELRRDAFYTLAPTVLALAAILLAATLFARRLSDPIQKLSLRMRDYSLGVELPPSVPPAAPRELQDLGQAFNVLIVRMNFAFEQANRLLEEQERLSGELGRTLAERDAIIAMRTAELRAANEELHRASRTDALTGCLNYRAFHEDMPRLIEESAADRSALAVVACDVDYFKRYNDHYGHPAGDRCLQRVASALRGALYGQNDLLARVGGEEFVALLPMADASDVAAVAERLRLAVQALGVPHAQSPFGVVTLSLGVVVVAGGDNPALDELLKRTDECLYRAKAEGRNRTNICAGG